MTVTANRSRNLTEKTGRKIIRRQLKDFAPQIYRKIVILCPNCYYFLKDKLEIQVLSIYEKLSQLGIGQKVDGREVCSCHVRTGRPAVGIMAGAVLSEETRYYKRYTVLWLGRLRRRKGSRSLPAVWHAM